jgi:hypothetical protein
MIDQGYGGMGYLGEAVSVCSSTIAWLNEQERERSDWELQISLSRLGGILQHFIDASTRGELPGVASKESLQIAIYSSEIVNSMTRTVTKQVGDCLDSVSERFRESIRFLLNQIEELSERVEDIIEAWQIPLDQRLSSKIDRALQQIDSAKTDIPDWRDALELISD